jgi:uncharacterized protein YqjF (DUF2071 family)
MWRGVRVSPIINSVSFASVAQHPSLRSLNHRPWPLPTGPWTWRQTWHDLLFLHWPIAAGDLRPLIPDCLEIDEHSGSAWVGVIPFWMSGVAPRTLPALPIASSFPELNVRTYVRLGERRGVWFLSLDAGSRLAVWAARWSYHLPYVYASMDVRHGDQGIGYRSVRADGVGFVADYAPGGPPVLAPPGALEHWFVERYCLYTRARSGRIYRADIHHEPWPLQPARAHVTRNDMLRVHGIAIEGPAAHQHFARRLDVVVWPLEPV